MAVQELEQRRENLEEHAVVLDYLPTGRSSSVRSEPLVQIMGDEKFTLLHLVSLALAQLVELLSVIECALLQSTKRLAGTS